MKLRLEMMGRSASCLPAPVIGDRFSVQAFDVRLFVFAVHLFDSLRRVGHSIGRILLGQGRVLLSQDMIGLGAPKFEVPFLVVLNAGIERLVEIFIGAALRL